MQVERHPGTGAAPPLGAAGRGSSSAMHNDFGGPLTLATGRTYYCRAPSSPQRRATWTKPRTRCIAISAAIWCPGCPLTQPPLVQFNTWFPPRPGGGTSPTRRRAADAAAAIGAQVYVLDSGWYTSGDWEQGLWVTTSPIPRSSREGLEELARHVHDKGMKFGLWVEIENAGNGITPLPRASGVVPAIRREPWVTADRCQLDFANPAVRQWASATVGPPGAALSARLDQDRL